MDKTITTSTGYVNPIGRTGEKGTDHLQYFYRMLCLDCTYEYKANGTDIHDRKCPRCQGGRA